MLFYILIIIMIILLVTSHGDGEKQRKKKSNIRKIFDLKRDVLSQTSDVAKYLLLS